MNYDLCVVSQTSQGNYNLTHHQPNKSTLKSRLDQNQNLNQRPRARDGFLLVLDHYCRLKFPQTCHVLVLKNKPQIICQCHI